MEERSIPSSGQSKNPIKKSENQEAEPSSEASNKQNVCGLFQAGPLFGQQNTKNQEPPKSNQEKEKDKEKNKEEGPNKQTPYKSSSEFNPFVPKNSLAEDLKKPSRAKSQIQQTSLSQNQSSEKNKSSTKIYLFGGNSTKPGEISFGAQPKFGEPSFGIKPQERENPKILISDAETKKEKKQESQENESYENQSSSSIIVNNEEQSYNKIEECVSARHAHQLSKSAQENEEEEYDDEEEIRRKTSLIHKRKEESPKNVEKLSEPPEPILRKPNDLIFSKKQDAQISPIEKTIFKTPSPPTTTPVHIPPLHLNEVAQDKGSLDTSDEDIRQFKQYIREDESINSDYILTEEQLNKLANEEDFSLEENRLIQSEKEDHTQSSIRFHTVSERNLVQEKNKIIKKTKPLFTKKPKEEEFEESEFEREESLKNAVLQNTREKMKEEISHKNLLILNYEEQKNRNDSDYDKDELESKTEQMDFVTPGMNISETLPKLKNIPLNATKEFGEMIQAYIKMGKLNSDNETKIKDLERQKIAANAIFNMKMEAEKKKQKDMAKEFDKQKWKMIKENESNMKDLEDYYKAKIIELESKVKKQSSEGIINLLWIFFFLAIIYFLYKIL